MARSVPSSRLHTGALAAPAIAALLGLAVGLSGCAAKQDATVLAPTEWQVRVQSPVQSSTTLARSNPAEGTGLTRVARSSTAAMLAVPGISDAAVAPRVLVDPSQVILNGPMDAQTLADRLRCELNEAANGRMQFLDRTTADVQRQKNRPAPEYRLEIVAAPSPAPAPGAKAGATAWAITLRLLGARATTPAWSDSYVCVLE